MSLLRTRWLRLGIVAGLLVALTGTSFLIVRSARTQPTAVAAPQAQATPTERPLPPPGATPNTTEPGWYVPYLNADAERPQFQGEKAGIQIKPYDQSTPPEEAGGCPPGTQTLRELVEDAVNKQALGIRLGSMANAVTAAGPPRALECDGKLITVSQYFDVAEGKGGGPAGGSLKVFRSAQGHRFWLPAPADRWNETTLAGRSAATVSPVVGTVGTSAVILNDGAGYTAVVGEGVSLEFLKSVALEIEK